MKLHRGQLIQSLKVSLSPTTSGLYNLVRACKMQPCNGDYKTWIDWQGYGFSIQKSYKEIILDKKENPHDLGFRAFPPNYVDQCDLLLILEQEKRYRVWFWNPERFFRFAIFEDNKWLPATPCSAGCALSAKVLDYFIRNTEMDASFAGHPTDLPPHLEALFYHL